jgi:tRNA pseudouridine38-40 synthase
LTRYALTIEYIGKDYSGSQIQPNKSTVQGELEKALSTLIGEKGKQNPKLPDSNKRQIKTIFSGRTDKGVNAKGQVVHFDTERSIVASRFIHSMNGLLPDDISVSDIKEVSTDFHAQKSACKRHYQYVFYNRKIRSAFDKDFLLIKWDLNIDRMQASLKYLEGEHDFSALRSLGSSVLNPICFIYKAECKKLGDAVVIDIVGNRFLYNMVRTIVGTLLLIEKNDLPPEFMKQILEGKDRTKAGKTVNPLGLTLMKVEY